MSPARGPDNSRFYKSSLHLFIMTLSALLVMSQAHGDNPRYKLDEEGTPLAKALKSEDDAQKSGGPPAKGKKFKSFRVKKGKKDCNPNNPNCDPDTGSEVECQDCGEILKNGKIVARKKRSQIDIEYEYEGTDPVRLRLRVPSELTEPGEGVAGLVDSETSLSYTRLGPPPDFSAANIGPETKCVDLVTGAKIENGFCFEGQVLKKNLEALEITADAPIRSCLHKDPRENSITETIYEPEQDPAVDGICFDQFGNFKETSLVPLIGEEKKFGAALCKDLFNNDGFSDLEKINPNLIDYVVEDDGAAYCDFTRAFMLKANMKDSASPEPVGPLFLVDEKGDLVDPEKLNEEGKKKYKNAKRYSGHTRKAKIREDVTLKCRGNMQLIDDKCWDIDRAARSFPTANMRSAELNALQANTGMDYPARSDRNGMLMGFTWAPPVEEWGYSIYEEGCLLGVCVELLDARIGYKFDVAAGLRFPIDVTMENLPPESNLAGDSVIAESQVSVKASVEPKDWTVGEFKEYCTSNNLPYDCEDRFAFPEYFDNFLNELAKPLGLAKLDNEIDGSEAVARADVFIGGKLEVLGIELLGLYLGADVDIMTACTANKLRSYYTEKGLSVDAAINYESFAAIFGGENVAKSLGLICGSFATPFGEDDGFTLATLTIPASCDEADDIPFTKTSNKPSKKLCSKLELEKKGAKLGIDINLDFGLTGNKIKSKASVGLDGCLQSGTSKDAAGQVSCTPRSQNLAWTPGNLDQQFVINADNFANRQNSGSVALTDFSLDLVPTVKLGVALNFGGVLDLIPNIGLDLYTLVLPAPAISISQHDDGVSISEKYFVRNYALSVDGQTSSTDPKRVDVDTLSIRPGETGQFNVKVKNLGSVDGDFDNFRAALSTRPDQRTLPYSFEINRNNDFDCEDSAGNHFTGYPYDDTPDGCWDAQGKLLSGREELIDEDGIGPENDLLAERDEDGDGIADEDPKDTWVAVFDPNLFIAGVRPDTYSAETGILSVSPFLHPLTKPGIYAVQILADSVEAKSNGLAAKDPVGQYRINAEDVVFFEVEPFYDPLVFAQALTETAKPGVGKAYTIEVSNGSNVEDSIVVATTRVDSNQGNCSLTTLGSSAVECPFRATPTAIPLGWTNGELPTPTRALQPLEMVSNQLTVAVPTDWAGMEDTTYQVVFTVTSSADPDDPAASRNVKVEQTVTATMESMTRYIGLELAELIAVLDQVNANDIKTAGLKPISINAVQRANDRGLASILSGNLRSAARSHAANIRIMGGFTRALAGSGKSLPSELFNDLNARAAAIIADMTKAESNQIPSN